MTIDWVALNAFLDRWGFPVLLLIVIGLGTWRWVLPIVKQRIERADRIADEQAAKLEANQKEYIRQSEERVQLFTNALGKMTTSFNDGQNRIVQALNDHDSKSAAQHTQIVQSLQEQGRTLQQVNSNLQQVNVNLEKLARTSSVRRAGPRRLP